MSSGSGSGSGSSSSASSGGIGLAGLLTIVFVILKLNPGGHLTTGVVGWPWFEWWGVCVLCPVIWSVYLGVAILGLVFGVILVAAIVTAIFSAVSK